MLPSDLLPPGRYNFAQKVLRDPIAPLRWRSYEIESLRLLTIQELAQRIKSRRKTRVYCIGVSDSDD